ncbi:YbhB/YbcL family Raf kinase inhibitor-like protein [Candidatus Uhrbacteria bacterium]|nr:YbhB/YbcL family Raf kinase inhibitor-like protein [Candidatus Uhrbacteria bacterium]
MKKLLWAVVVIFVAFWAVWIGVFYYKNLRGIGPAVRAPKEDIAELIDNPPTPSLTLREGENRTGMPLKLPPGFSIEIFAKDLPGARVMVPDSFGGFLVSQTSEGNVSEIMGDQESGRAVDFGTYLSGLRKPHGMVVDPKDQEHFFIAEEDKISEFYVATMEGPGFSKIVDLPSGGNHTTRTLGFGPDGRLYVSIGSSCNVCNENDPRRAAIYVVDIENKKLIPYATGLRNSVFFTWSYVDGRMWATEMGRDLLGDDLPPDEINIVEGPSADSGQNPPDFGWPICYGKNIHDSVFDKNVYVRDPCADKVPSYIDLPAHSAPLGLAFIPKDAGWPKEYEGDLLVAYHGSWNRTKPTGYKVVRIKLDAQGNYEGMEDFISGWLQDDGTALGRPVDILVQSGGVMYISDDKAGVIYRVTYSPLTHNISQSMRIESPAFGQNERIPKKYTCDGEDVNPPLTIADVPEGTKSLALIHDDPDATDGTWVHWTVWNITPDTRALEEGKVPQGAMEGTQSWGRTGYGGPCPPSGAHRYFFKLYALDATLDLPASTDAQGLTSAMEGHILAQAELIGLYERQ